MAGYSLSSPIILDSGSDEEEEEGGKGKEEKEDCQAGFLAYSLPYAKLGRFVISAVDVLLLMRSRQWLNDTLVCGFIDHWVQPYQHYNILAVSSTVLEQVLAHGYSSMSLKLARKLTRSRWWICAICIHSHWFLACVRLCHSPPLSTQSHAPIRVFFVNSLPQSNTQQHRVFCHLNQIYCMAVCRTQGVESFSSACSRCNGCSMHVGESGGQAKVEYDASMDAASPAAAAEEEEAETSGDDHEIDMFSSYLVVDVPIQTTDFSCGDLTIYNASLVIDQIGEKGHTAGVEIEPLVYDVENIQSTIRQKLILEIMENRC